jgi:hypothetical protein
LVTPLEFWDWDLPGLCILLFHLNLLIMTLNYFKSKKNDNYIIACAGGKLIIGHSSLTEKEFESAIANAEGNWAGDNYLVGFRGNGGTVEVKSLKLGAEDGLPVVEV